jgi:hypothetical protein
MMERCRAKRGFFSLRDCGDPADAACTECKRPMCSLHRSPASGFARCLDCEARKPVAQGTTTADAQTPADPTVDDLNDPVWPYRYRRRYYSSHRYSPTYVGAYYDSYYNDYDYRTFDRGMRDDRSFSSDDSGTGFGDS